MTPHRVALVAVLLVSSATAGAETSTKADLAVRARRILAKHCSSCHGDKPDPSTLGVLDHAQMVKPTGVVSFIRPGSPNASQALELIEEGSMPPGNNAKVSADEVRTLREWIESGATAYPVRFDDEFAYRTILEHVKELNAAELKNTRYLSLHHLADDGSNADISKARSDFLTGVRSVIKKGAPGPVPLDATQTVFQIELDKSDWGHRRFKRLDDDGNMVGEPIGNLFDVVLLEYPFAVVPRQSAAFDELVSRFLAKAEQVRAVAFVRGDWFVESVTSAPLADDLRELIRPVAVVPPGLSSPKPPVVRKADAAASSPGVVVLPALDAWYGADPAAHPESPPGFVADTYHASVNEVRRKFDVGTKLRLRYMADKAAHFQYLWVAGDGMVTPSEVLARPAMTRTEKTLPKRPEGLGIDGDVKERFLVYASPHAFDEGQTWRTLSGKIERYVHPFFAIKQAGDKMIVSTEDARIARKTIPIEIVPKKK